MSSSPQRQTAVKVVEAFNRMDIDTIISYRSPDCMRYILPSTLGHPPTDNETYRTSLERLKPIFSNFNLTVHDLIEDQNAGRICMQLKARADTLAGEYINEYMLCSTGVKLKRRTCQTDTGTGGQWTLTRPGRRLRKSTSSSTLL